MLFEQVQLRDVEDDTGKEEPYREQGQSDVENLSDNVKPEDFAALHLFGDLLEVGVKSDAGESENERPVLVLVKDTVDGRNL